MAHAVDRKAGRAHRQAGSERTHQRRRDCSGCSRDVRARAQARGRGRRRQARQARGRRQLRPARRVLRRDAAGAPARGRGAEQLGRGRGGGRR